MSRRGLAPRAHDGDRGIRSQEPGLIDALDPRARRLKPPTLVRRHRTRRRQPRRALDVVARERVLDRLLRRAVLLAPLRSAAVEGRGHTGLAELEFVEQ